MKCHQEAYIGVMKAMHLKHHDSTNDANPDGESRELLFSIEEWVRRLVKWVVIDDQVCS